MTLYDSRDKILSLIDRGTWKHSWHLPRNRHGWTDWFSKETRKKVRQILLDDLEETSRLKEELEETLRRIGGKK